MARLHFLSGSIALIALAGVNAGPCRPSSSVVTTPTGLETTATMSADIGDTTTVLLTSLAATESTETLAVTLSASETAVATTTAVASDTTTVVTTDAATTTADTTTTTTAPATTSAAPAEACHGLPREYTAPQGTTFDIDCGTSPSQFFRVFDQPDASDFKTCVDICAQNILCSGAIWIQASSGCLLVDTYDGTEASDSRDFARFRSRGS